MTRLAVVLGAGGIGAQAFHFGVLERLVDDGLDLADVEVFLGTSAGSVMALALADGTPLDELRDRLLRRPDERDRDRDDIAPRPDEPRRGLRRLLPNDPALLRHAIREPGLAWTGLAPQGPADSRWWVQPGVLPTSWPERARVAAADLDRAEVNIMGRDLDRTPSPQDAVAASMAVPGLARPVLIDGRRHVDGAVLSSTHADEMLAEDPDVVLVSAAMARPSRRAGRILARRRLDAEVRSLTDAGVHVIAVAPDEAAAETFAGFPVRRPEAAADIRAAGRRLGPSLRELLDG